MKSVKKIVYFQALAGSFIFLSSSVALAEVPVNPNVPLAPVLLNLTGKNLNLVKRGSYLVNAVGGCNDCHTNPSYEAGGDPFKGEAEAINVSAYLGGGRAFGPTITSANITPDAAGKPAGLTRTQFINLIRTGRHHEDPTMILQVMPWPVYKNMTDSDLKAIYEYLRAIPSIP